MITRIHSIILGAIATYGLTLPCATLSQAAAADWAPTSTHAHPLERSNARIVSYMAVNESIPIVVALKINDRAGLLALVDSQLTPGNSHYRKWRPHEELMTTFAPTPAQVSTVTNFLTRMGFADVVVEEGGLTVRATGTAGVIRRSFNTELAHVRTADGRDAIANTKDVQVPAALDGLVEAVLGLQTVDLPHVMTVQTIQPSNWPAIYDATSLPTGSKTTVGVVTVGLMTQTLADFASYQNENSIAPLTPSVVYVGTGTQVEEYAEGEWDMDTQNILAMSGNALGGMILYAAPSFSDADLTSTYSRIESANAAKVINVSLGECEASAYSDGALSADDAIFALAVAQGQTFSVASGDRGSNQCGSYGINGQIGETLGVSYPASSPYVVAVGGTVLSTGSGAASYVSEVAWGASGGGPSAYENQPLWQTGIVPGTKRGVPDLAFDADFNVTTSTGGVCSGYTTQCQTICTSTVTGCSNVQYYCTLLTGLSESNGCTGAVTLNGGTSLASPLFVGIWARMESGTNNTLGFPAPLIYRSASAHPEIFHDITVGSNSAYSAGTGWDYVTGFGSLDVAKAYPVLRAQSLAWLPAVLSILLQ